jgi:transcriptional regulator with XRE-family HTH domain
VDICAVIQRRLKELGLEQRDLAGAAQVTESYISQLLTRKKAPPAAARTDIYEKMNTFLKLPKGHLSAIVEDQRREEWKKKLADPPAPLYREVRGLVIKKCRAERQKQVREIFEKQSFGELERLVTQTLLDVCKKIAKGELENERWLRNVAKLRGQSYEEARTIILEFLDTDVFHISVTHCAVFLTPIIESWDIDLVTFGIDIRLNQLLSPVRQMSFQYVEREGDGLAKAEPGFTEFLGLTDLSGDATEEELEFLRCLRFKSRQPTSLYYYRELQNLRDPLHFRGSANSAGGKRRDGRIAEKREQLDTRRSAVRRWMKNTRNSRKKNI